MGCICKANLNSILSQIKKLPLALLASAFPQPISVKQMANLSATLGAQASASAQLSGMAQLAATANLSANLSASAVAKLEALAAIKQQLGINLLVPSANASASLALAIQSANLHLPTFAQMLAEIMAPIQKLLNEISAAMGAMLAVNSQLGINLMASASANLQAALSARLAALAALKAQASAKLNASVQAVAKLDLHARLTAAAGQLGFNLAVPGAFAKLNASLKLGARITVPDLNLGKAMMGAIASALGQLAAVLAGLGLNLLSPGAAKSLLSAKASLHAAINAMAKLDLKTAAAGSLNARAQAQLSAKASASASAKAAAAINFNGLKLGMVPFFPQLNVLANLTAQLSATAPVMATSPCSSCTFGK